MTEKINHPPHYNQSNEIECIDAIAAAGYAEGMCLGSAMKYIWRYKLKNGAEDLKKARWYLDWWINYLESESQMKDLEATLPPSERKEKSISKFIKDGYGYPERKLISDDLFPHENA